MLLQFKAKVSLLTGCIPGYRVACSSSEEARLSFRSADLSAACSLCVDGEVLGLPSRTRPREADLDGCEWQEWLHYYVKVLYTCSPVGAISGLTVMQKSTASQPAQGLHQYFATMPEGPKQALGTPSGHLQFHWCNRLTTKSNILLLTVPAFCLWASPAHDGYQAVLGLILHHHAVSHHV